MSLIKKILKLVVMVPLLISMHEVHGCTRTTPLPYSAPLLGSEAKTSLKSSPFPSFAAWKNAVGRLPRLKESKAINSLNFTIDYTKITRVPELSEEVFNAALDEYCAYAQGSSLKNADAWLDGKVPDASFYTMNKPEGRGMYVEKVLVPEDSILLVHGDLHGAAHGLLAELAEYIDIEHGFKLKNPKMYMVFLGDYVDRGGYGYECIYTLLCLKNANPDRVFLVRGNHEDEYICSTYGFYSELTSKKVSEQTIKKIYTWYELLPAALFVICNNEAVQFCHGGIEPTYTPKLLLHAASSVQFERVPALTSRNGFMWTDFTVDSRDCSSFKDGRGNVYGAKDTQKYLQSASGEVQLQMIIRAHQHGGRMMQRILGRDGCNEDNQGAAKLWTTEKRTGDAVWSSMVVTLNVAEDTTYGCFYDNFDYDTHGLLTLGEKFSDWRLKIHRTQAPKHT